MISAPVDEECSLGMRHDNLCVGRLFRSILLPGHLRGILRQQSRQKNAKYRFLRNLADANYGMLRGCTIFHPPRFLQTIRLWSLPVLVLVLSVLTLFALMEHAKLEQIKLGSTIHTSFNEF